MLRYLALLAAVAAPLCAQDWARQQLDKSPRHHEWVTVKHDGRSVETFVVYPESKDKTPVVLIIHASQRTIVIARKAWMHADLFRL